VREALSSSLLAKLGALLASQGLRALRDRMDPRGFNGGPFLGLNGIVIKSHGGMDAFGFASAIGVGYDMAESDLVAHLAADLDALHGKISEGGPSEEKQA
jgi:glycerol-3-phosphate acyltransferase PlsX